MQFNIKEADVSLRLEKPDDYRAVEVLTREAFWNTGGYRELVFEHYIVHKMRTAPAFIPELAVVAEINGVIVGNVMFTKAEIINSSGAKTEVLKLGPLSVLPEYQGFGVGRALLTHSLAEAKRFGYRAVLLLGHPDYYPRFGFCPAAQVGIVTESGGSFDGFMAMELYKGALDGAGGRFIQSPVFGVDIAEAVEYDKNFSAKEKAVPIPISVLLEKLDKTSAEAIASLGIKYLDELRSKSEREIIVLSGGDGNVLEIVRKVIRNHGFSWGKL